MMRRSNIFMVVRVTSSPQSEEKVGGRDVGERSEAAQAKIRDLRKQVQFV